MSGVSYSDLPSLIFFLGITQFLCRLECYCSRFEMMTLDLVVSIYTVLSTPSITTVPT